MIPVTAAGRQLWRLAPRTKFVPSRKIASLSSEKSLPLQGIKVVDLTRVLAGPPCAEITKIEHPVRGDDTRQWGRPYAPYLDGRSGPGESAYYLSVNRNKKSVGVSFQHPEGAAIIRELAQTADIFVENFLPGTLKRYGLDFATLEKTNPRLIYASITGYGQYGPYHDRAGYDVMVEAEMGLMHITGTRDGPPVKVGCAVTDLTTGMYACNSIMAALLERHNSHRGQHLDVCLSDCQVATLSNMAESVLISKKRDSGRWGTAHPSVVPYRAFKTSDGDVLFGGGNDRLFGILCSGLGKQEWASDERFATNAARVANRNVLEPAIEEITRQKTTQEWLDIFDGTGLPYAKVNDLMDTLNHEHVRARGMVVSVDHPSCGVVDLVNTPIKYSRSRPSIRSPPPLLGEHTDEILSTTLGLAPEKIRDLRASGAVG
ncbi:hypothetical protein AYO20_08561 [Fonsecaea nubica]|uniref:Uncharacterized protein n=1 Tax=Fonsecaea nubica TaxID=856822 RepID=A0A178CLW5_9EURO|nr:hypothetical protein AYO20_08561 [Fonsecaea nubica]OAL30868.1 hypothetical protein AYO20_08561 [Fonsecaea nubica]